MSQYSRLDATADLFGLALATDGNTVLVSGVRGDNGSVSVYKRDCVTKTWLLQGQLIGQVFSFGHSVAVQNDLIAVGSPSANGGLVTVYDTSATDPQDYTVLLTLRPCGISTT